LCLILDRLRLNGIGLILGWLRLSRISLIFDRFRFNGSGLILDRLRFNGSGLILDRLNGFSIILCRSRLICTRRSWIYWRILWLNNCGY
jgi:hypothetical protein